MLLAALLLLGACSNNPGNHVVNKGDTLPAMKLHDLSGKTVYSRELFAGKVIIFNVWATWCPPCRKEMPDLLRLSQILPKDRFMVAALSVDKNLDDVRAFVHEHGLTFPVFWDQEGRAIAEPELGVFKYPETLVINREGKVVTKVIGAYPWAGAETVRALKYIARYGDIPAE